VVDDGGADAGAASQRAKASPLSKRACVHEPSVSSACASIVIGTS
jgi:hypothetical protein